MIVLVDLLILFFFLNFVNHIFILRHSKGFTLSHPLDLCIYYILFSFYKSQFAFYQFVFL